jgi:hypothetical protein
MRHFHGLLMASRLFHSELLNHDDLVGYWPTHRRTGIHWWRKTRPNIRDSGSEVVPGLVEVEVAVPRLRPTKW